MKKAIWVVTAIALLAAWPGRAQKALEAGWLDRVSQDIQKREYDFSRQADGSWSAPNRAHNVRTRISSSVVSLTSRTRGEQFWTLEMRLAGFGAGERVSPAAVRRVTAQGGRAEIERDGLTEWYVNDSKGLEQGFTIASRPAMAPADAPLVLDLAVGGTVKGERAGDGRSIHFNTPSGSPVLRYGDLKVVDDSGRELRADLATTSAGLRIRVEDSGARYPIVVDPLLSSPWGSQGDQASARLGFAVATAGDVNGDNFSDVIVGAPLYDAGQTDEGKAFLYLGSATGPGAVPDWTAEGDEANAWLGYSAATAGDVNGDGFGDVIIGAPNFDGGGAYGGGADAGGALVFLGGASGLGASGTPSNADWIGTVTLPISRFGIVVGTAGDVNSDGYDDILVSADRMDDGTLTDEGWVLVWYGSATGLGDNGLQYNADWHAEGDEYYAWLGASSGTAGDVNGDGYDDIVVGAPNKDLSYPLADEGRAMVWLGSSTGLGATGSPSNADWTVSGNQDFERLGSAVAAAGDTNGDGYADILVGAPFYDNGQTDEGAAFLFRGSATGPVSPASWTVEGDQADARFGAAVATAGDVNGDGFADVAASAPLYDNGQTDEGRAFMYQGGLGGASTVPAWTAEGDQAGAQFGGAIATAGDVDGNGFGDFLVGSSYYDSPDVDEGRAFLYTGAAAGPSSTAGWQTNGGFQQPGDGSGVSDQHFGTSVGTAGDLNGDGYSDIIVGAPLNDRVWLNQFGGYDTTPDTGRALIYLGSRGPVATLATIKVDLASEGSQMGFSVASAGDVNGDGLSDIIVGAPYYDSGQVDAGRAFVYLGDSVGLDTAFAWWAEGVHANAHFGISVGTAGDVNGDGFSDVIIGSEAWDDGTQIDEGAAFVWFGGACDLPSNRSGLGVHGVENDNHDWKAEGNLAGSHFGASVATAGDVNRDGFSDVIVGAPLYQSSQTLDLEGRAYVFLGSISGLGGTAVWSPVGGQKNGKFGTSVGSAGDVNGDGFSDVIVGQPGYGTGPNAKQGRAAVYHGTSSGPSASASWTAQSGQSNAQLGTSAATAGDVNADGFSDVIVGAPLYNAGQNDEGRSFLYLGSETGLEASAAWTAESNEAGGQFGYAVATAGDVNGDGFADVLVGAPLLNNGLPSDQGFAYLYYGNGGRGLDRVPQQVRATGGPIQLLGKTYDPGTSFKLLALGRTAAGRGKVHLQWEAKPLGTPFDGSGLGQGAKLDTGTPAADGSGSKTGLSGTQSGLTANTVYTWRLRIASDSPLFPRTPWVSMPYNGRAEADLLARTGTPAVCSLHCICDTDFCLYPNIRCHNLGCCTSGFCGGKYNCCQYGNCVYDESCSAAEECPPNEGNPAGTCSPCGGQ